MTRKRRRESSMPIPTTLLAAVASPSDTLGKQKDDQKYNTIENRLHCKQFSINVFPTKI
jgi:hypothetical protein